MYKASKDVFIMVPPTVRMESICSSTYLSVYAQLYTGAYQGCSYHRTLIGNHMLEVKPTGQHSCIVPPPGNGRNGNNTITGTASKAFTRWLHQRYAPIELPLVGIILYHSTIQYIVNPRNVVSPKPFKVWSMYSFWQYKYGIHLFSD